MGGGRLLEHKTKTTSTPLDVSGCDSRWGRRSGRILRTLSVEILLSSSSTKSMAVTNIELRFHARLDGSVQATTTTAVPIQLMPSTKQLIYALLRPLKSNTSNTLHSLQRLGGMDKEISQCRTKHNKKDNIVISQRAPAEKKGLEKAELQQK